MNHAEQIFMDALKQSRQLDYSLEEALADIVGQMLFDLECVCFSTKAAGIMGDPLFKKRFMEHVDMFFKQVERERNETNDEDSHPSG